MRSTCAVYRIIRPRTLRHGGLRPANPGRQIRGAAHSGNCWRCGSRDEARSAMTSAGRQAACCQRYVSRRLPPTSNRSRTTLLDRQQSAGGKAIRYSRPLLRAATRADTGTVSPEQAVSGQSPQTAVSGLLTGQAQTGATRFTRLCRRLAATAGSAERLRQTGRQTAERCQPTVRPVTGSDGSRWRDERIRETQEEAQAQWPSLLEEATHCPVCSPQFSLSERRTPGQCPLHSVFPPIPCFLRRESASSLFGL